MKGKIGYLRYDEDPHSLDPPVFKREDQIENWELGYSKKIVYFEVDEDE